MNAKTVRPFTDKETGAVRYVGDEFECSKERFNKLHGLALVEKSTEGDEKDEKGGIEYMTMPQLDEYAAGIGIDTTKVRRKADKIAAIEAAETSTDETEDAESEDTEDEEGEKEE